MTPSTLVILGMHRSGTSSVTGALTLAGAQAPLTLMPAKPDNPTGFWESERIAFEDDVLLRRFEAEWFTPGQFDASELARDPDVIAHLVGVLEAEFPDPAGPPILKDPRMCRLAPPWFRAAEAWGRPPRVILPVRPPAEVAASLHRRNDLPLAHGLRLWIDHVVQAERDSRGLPRAVVLWPDVLADPVGALERAMREIDLPLDVRGARAALGNFIDPERRHERLTLDDIADPVATRAAEVYDAIASLNRSASDPAAQSRLDAIGPSPAP